MNNVMTLRMRIPPITAGGTVHERCREINRECSIPVSTTFERKDPGSFVVSGSRVAEGLVVEVVDIEESRQKNATPLKPVT